MNDHCVDGKISAANETHFVVALDSESSCKSCGMSNVCSSKTIEFEKDKFGTSFDIGQKVKVEYEKVIQTSAILYLIPIFFFFGGIGICRWLLNIQNELIQFGGAMLALGLAFLIVNFLNKSLTSDNYKINIKPVN